MNRSDIDDKWLYAHMPAADDLLLDQLPENSTLNHTFSEQYEKRKQKLLKRETHAAVYRLARSMRHKAAIVLLFLLVTFTTLTLSVEAFREYLFKTINQITENWINTSFITDDTAPAPFLPETFGYIPDGFELDTEHSDDISHYAVYKNLSENTEQEFIYSKLQINESMVTGTPRNPESTAQVLIKGTKAELYYIDGSYTLQYQKAGFYYTFTGINMAEDEFFKTAESLTSE